MSIRFDYYVILFVFILPRGYFAVLYKGDNCSLKDGSQGICKLIKECPAAVQLIRTGVNPIICGFEETESIVCCKDGAEETKTTSTSRTTEKITRRRPGDISKQKCKEYAEYAYEKIQSPTLLLNPHFTKKLLCDIPRNRLVVASSFAARREFPHMASIGYKSYNEVEWLCSGSLISENFVLTSAHCLFLQIAGPPKLVRIGITNKTDLAHMQERIVSESIPHPKYNDPMKYHDIALLKLSDNVKFNTYARPTCLQTEKHIDFVVAIASGWGALSLERRHSNDLLAIVLEFYSADKCNQTYRRTISPTSTLKDGIVDDLMICAGTSKLVSSNICQGQSGGPLQVYHRESEEVKCMYDIIGVTSFGLPPCGLENDKPEVYIRVSAYIKWIEDTVWPN